MGADLWEAVGPWHENPDESLRVVQRHQLAQRYKLPGFLIDRLSGVREALRLTQAGDDHPALRDQLLELYSAEVAYLEDVLNKPLPVDSEGQLAIVRRVCGADGCGGVLDVKAVNNSEDFATARPLTGDERTQIFGTPTPTAADVSKSRGRLPDAGRAGSYCFPVYDGNGAGIAWHFYGRTFD